MNKHTLSVAITFPILYPNIRGHTGRNLPQRMDRLQQERENGSI